MILPLRKIIFTLLFNSSLFLMLIIGIQNNSNRSKVDFLLDKTINLPISFIVGTSFISGSLFGSLISFYFRTKNHLDWNKHIWTYNSWNTSWDQKRSSYCKNICIGYFNNFLFLVTKSFCTFKIKINFKSFSL